jgi:N-ethylmaleimide reductase
MSDRANRKPKIIKIPGPDHPIAPMTEFSHPNLFTPVQIGPIALKHRVVMAPLTRSRSEQPGDIPGALMIEYYAQRASDGGFIVSEGTSVSLTGRGWFGAPGLYSDRHVEG